ncbi:MAG: MFS transporter [Flavonifractor plautii]
MRSDRLFSRDFTLMVAGQIISLFGNAILRFALSLYVLDTTGSAAVFGGILAVSMVPTILCSPLGGVLADRVPRQRIMWGLDFFTAALVLGYGLFFASRGTVLAVGVLMVLLAAIQALYQPSVQASIPALASEEHLPAANGVVAQVQALANLLGPILGGMLYGWVGLLPMVAVGGACFFCSAVMELFLRIPFQRRTLAGPPLAALWRDLRDAGRFLTREQPGLLRCWPWWPCSTSSSPPCWWWVCPIW